MLCDVFELGGVFGFDVVVDDEGCVVGDVFGYF